ncbi:hypothetical protein [Methylobacterium sp. NEAU K]|uniref:hypothetical protein n=1 Tax=Methylobacterium sp. NEAU K TaxID=3064946 RepID=UPI0027354AFB|nr:hypothetical protein [Methylobacterium sp. NEAU K]MDP4006715.1 hypothetical protein [Methylobacterium sp. NEAU K]
MRFGVRRPSLRGRISARTSWKRYVRHSMGIKAPRGYGFLTNPKKALYNRVYNRTTVSADSVFKSKRSKSGPELGEGSEIPENLVIGLFACAVMIGLLMWLGLSFKLSLILTVLAGLMAILGEEAFKGLAILAFIAWFFLHG